MVRLLQKQRRLSTLSPPASAAPKIKFCVPWRYIFQCLIGFYGVGILALVYFLDGTHTKNSNNSNTSDNDMIKQILDVKLPEPGHFLEWIGSEHQDRYDSSSSGAHVQAELPTSSAQFTRIHDLEQSMQSKHPQRNLKLCRRTANTFDDATASPQFHATDPLASCPTLKADKAYYFFNPLHHDRYVCDSLVPARSALKVPAEMLGQNNGDGSSSDKLRRRLVDQSHMFTVLPNTTALGVPTTIVHDNDDAAPAAPWEDCDIPCRYGGYYDIISKRTIKNTPFELLFSMEGEAYYPELKIDRSAWSMHKYYATTSFRSDIPLPYFSFAEYNFKKYPPVNYDKAIKGALFMARNCHSTNNREQLVDKLIELQSIIRVDSVSFCMHNAEAPNGVSIDDKDTLLRQYLFFFAFENQNTIDYVTEKLWSALVAGTVPVYLGAENIKDHVPDNSVIVARDFSNAKALAVHLRDVASNRNLYESYHAWRQKELPAHFLNRYNITRTHNVCRTCRWAYAKAYGLGWSHDRQQLTNTEMPRHACLDQNGFMTWPVHERWSQSQNESSVEARSGNDATGAPKLCPSTRYLPWEELRTVSEDVRRTIYEHDGVIDLRVQRKGSSPFTAENPVVLELVVPFDSSVRFRRLAPGHLEWQSKTSRLTLLLQPAHATLYRRMNPNTVQIKDPHAVRIMVEDVDNFHDGAADAENYFGSLMKLDWETPIEVFVADKKK